MYPNVLLFVRIECLQAFLSVCQVFLPKKWKKFNLKPLMHLTLEKTVIVLILGIFCLQANAQEPIKPENAEEDQPLELYFSIEGGFYEAPVELKLFAPEAEIYYTLNGSKPTSRSNVYRRPIRIDETTVVRAVAKIGKKRSHYLGHTYFIAEPASNLATVSIGISPHLLFSPQRGLFMQGSNAIDTLWKKPGANFWSKKEVACNIEIFEPTGECVYRNLSGFRLFGGMSRLFPQKSIAIVARKRYGKNRIKHKIFGKGEPDKYKFLVLRNSGSDFGKSHFRDALMTSLVDHWDIEKQAYRPAHVYINGTYWGIYNIREKINRYFVEAHSEMDKDSIDLIEHRMSLKRGSRLHYLKMLDFLENNDLGDPVNYAYIQTQMDVQNFMDYQIAQIYFDNRDAGGNIRFWRPQTEDGRWRWILYDTDWGFGLHNKLAYKSNSLDFHTTPNGPSWPNPPWSTFILRKLLENPSFRDAFVNRFADHLNTSFQPYRVETKIEDLYKQIQPEIPRHLDRWNLSHSRWEDQVELLHKFGRERSNYVRMHLMEFFNTGGMRRLDLQATDGGAIIVNNNFEVRNEVFKGRYFENIPVSIKAVPDYGYRFLRWEGIEVDDNIRELDMSLTEKRYTIRAVFERFTHPMIGKVMINEISPNNKKSSDWIEIFNYSKNRVSLTEWTLTDSKNEFKLPAVSLDPNDYLVICQDSAKFAEAFPEAYNFIGGMPFGLNKRKEKLGLYSILGAVVDSVQYDLLPTDSTFTLNLLLPYLDNADPENWEMRLGVGSPNDANPYYVESSIRMRQEQWMQMGVAAGVVLICMLLLVLRWRGTL